MRGEKLTGWLKTVARYVAPLALAAFLPLLLGRSQRYAYCMDVAILCLLYIALALGLNIVVGFAGLLDLGYVAFYAVGAYLWALAGTRLGWSFWIALPLSGLVAAIFGVLIGVPTLRLRGDYLAIVTLGFGEIVRLSLNNMDPVTGGPSGIMDIPRPAMGTFEFPPASLQPLHFYYLSLAVALAAWFTSARLDNSRVGRAWKAVRDDEVAAAAMGIDVVRVKLVAFAIGAFFAGLAGATFAAKMGVVSPSSFTFWESILILCMVVLGGMGSIPGVAVGAIVLVLLPEVLREFAAYRMLVFGVAMAVMMILRPGGLLGKPQRGTSIPVA